VERYRKRVIPSHAIYAELVGPVDRGDAVVVDVDSPVVLFG
jgi:hypothetical protein